MKVVTIGEIVVEILATSRGAGFLEPLELLGPFPSGAPAIFIDQLVRQGQSGAIISCVGDDDFGRLNLQRLQRDTVDISGVRVHASAATGSAFVRYREDGSRDFVYNIRHSANQYIELNAEAESIIKEAAHLHVMGSSLFSGGVIDLIDHALGDIKIRGGTVSFDPNIRKEMLGSDELRSAMERVLEQTDLFMPSGEELFLFSSQVEEAAALQDILDRGVEAIVLKQARAGSRYISRGGDISVPGFDVEELDPTGAGDCFAGTFVARWLQGQAPERCLLAANAAGALAVTRRGPMEGASTAAEVDHFITINKVVL
ncbi:sugar kinase [Cephaloticoccus primus]|uniref:Sugar kinase n=1 Tax=Cephaloticoccus primus TaxID=1548207 RepID=A0A139STC7_9BACT|nr:sugar kinase [Cephaloticoccus primus]KXU37732.1 sugar kinase [Cephaloticoccus primus]